MSENTPNTPNTRLKDMLQKFKPFDALDRAHQTEILAWKKEYSEYDQELRDCLHSLAMPQLEPYLVWIPKLNDFKSLAEGGFAKVYQAWVILDSSVYFVAAKELKSSMVEELVLSIYLSRCTSNAPTMVIVGLSQHYLTEEYLMIMQFADIGTLEKQPCEEDGDWYTALTYALKLASRLASLHDSGFSHTDLHAGNVVFHKSHTTVLIDVGLSRAVEEVYGEDGVYGRIEYLPPEIFEDKKHTQKSDIYCLGTLLWQLIVGVPPQGIASVAISNPDGLRDELIPGAPKLFNAVIRSCWHVNPDLRPSAHEVYNLLIQCAAAMANIPPVLQPNVELQILRALAISPLAFSLETQSFIAERRVTHQQKRQSGNSSALFEFADGHAGSKFHTCKQLKEYTDLHSQSALVTLVTQQTLEKSNGTNEACALAERQSMARHKTGGESISVIAKLLKQNVASHELNLSGKNIRDGAVRVLVEFLKNNNITTFDLSSSSD